MSRLRAAMAEHAAALDALSRTLANQCEQAAEGGVFHDPGQRCAWCLHALPGGGCRLRLIATK